MPVSEELAKVATSLNNAKLDNQVRNARQFIESYTLILRLSDASDAAAVEGSQYAGRFVAANENTRFTHQAALEDHARHQIRSLQEAQKGGVAAIAQLRQVLSNSQQALSNYGELLLS